MLKRIFFADFQMAFQICNEANLDYIALQVTSRIRPLSQLALHVSFDAQAPSKTPYSINGHNHRENTITNAKTPISRTPDASYWFQSAFAR
jgi:hypothetical protein